MEYIIPRILIDSFRANESIHPILPPFRPIARLERAPLLSSEGRIDRVENTGFFQKKGKNLVDDKF